MLSAVLRAVCAQRLTTATFNIVVVDNDADRSGEAAVRAVAREFPVAIHYDCEPERSISLARNRAIRNATGDLVAFIDDDELPPTDWLEALYRTFTTAACEGVLGPVLPVYPDAAPAWLRKANVFSRRRHATGTRIGEGDGRTGNVLLKRSLFTEGQCWFDPAFGRTGGEDSDFFHRQFQRGGVFLWCDEAVVTETVPPERWRMSFHIKRLLRAGTTDGELIRAGKLASASFVAKNAMILCACAALIPPSLILLPRHLWMRIAQKFAYSGGVVSAYCGWSLLKYRD
jgi:glycosyltransferase involved in cell wall biosynthesis